MGMARWLAVGVVAVAQGCGGEQSIANLPLERIEAAATGTVTVEALADATARAAYPASNYGTRTYLNVDQAPDEEAYLRFDVGGLPDRISRVVLRLYVLNGSTSGPALFQTATGWSETGLTWNSRPARLGSSLGAQNPASGAFVEYDVTALMTGASELSFALVPRSRDGADFASREDADVTRRPSLVVTFETGEEPPPPPPSGDAEKVFGAFADAAVREAAPNTNFGSTAALLADGSPRERSYLRFEVDGVTGPVSGAKLRLYVLDGSSRGPTLRLASRSWTESAITWANQPIWSSAEPTLGETGAISPGRWVELDVSSAVRGDGSYDFVLVETSSDGSDFASREHSDSRLRPQLVVTYFAGEPPPDDCVPFTQVFRGERLDPHADLFVDQSRPTARFGSAQTLEADGDPRKEAYLRVEINNGGRSVTSARLKLYVLDGSSDGPRLYRANAEQNYDFDWAGRPALLGAPLGDLGAVSAGTWVEYDVTAAVQQDGLVAFGLIPTSSNGVDFASLDHPDSSKWPQVELSYEVTYCGHRGAPAGNTTVRSHLQVDDGQTAGPSDVGSDGSSVVTFWLRREGLTQLNKYSPAGALQWSRRLPVGIEGIAITPLGNVLLAGTYVGAPNLGTGGLPNAGTAADLYIAKLNADGSTSWARGFAPRCRNMADSWDGQVHPRAVATDANGSLILTGQLVGELDVGAGVTGEWEHCNSTEILTARLTAKFDWQGNAVWSQAEQSQAVEEGAIGFDVATDPAGTAYVAGTDGLYGVFESFSAAGERRTLYRGAFGAYHGVATVPGGVAYLGYERDTYYAGADRNVLAVLNSDGSRRWERTLSTAPWSTGLEGLDADPDGNLIAHGSLGSAGDFGGGTLFTDAIAGPVRFAARFSAAGAHLWSRVFDPGYRISDVEAYADGSTLIVGSFEGSMTLDGVRYGTQTDGDDVLMLRVAP